MDRFRYGLGERVRVQGTGAVGTVLARQPAQVYQVALPGREQPAFYAESQLAEAPGGPQAAGGIPSARGASGQPALCLPARGGGRPVAPTG
jgi:hypothetical protein